MTLLSRLACAQAPKTLSMIVFHKGGSCGGISLKRDKCHLYLKRLPALAQLQAGSSPIPKIRKCSTVMMYQQILSTDIQKMSDSN